MSKVTVKPLPERKWHGKSGKESFARPKVIEVLYNPETGKYATGLTEDEAKEYGKKLGGVDLSDTFNSSEPHSFWSQKSAHIRLENSLMIFDTNKPSDYVKVKNMKASKFVANSMKEYEEGKWPDATHVIFDEDAETEQKASKVSLRKRCYEFLAKMTMEDQINIIQILLNRSVRGKSPDYLQGEIGELIEQRPDEFLGYMELGREEVETRAKVLELLGKGILTKEAGAIYYLSDLIAGDFDDAVKWFKSPENSKVKAVILEKLNKQ